MAANIAGLALSLNNDDGTTTDLADRINPRFINLTLTEKRGGEADELSITLHNTDGALAIPETGAILSLALGWASGDEVTALGVVGLVDKGRFKVDEVELSGPPDMVTIKARAADLSGDYAKRRTQSWKGTTVAAIINAIAARNDVAAQVHPDLAGKVITAIEQHGKSDMAFVRDLGKRFDAVATWKNRTLLFMPIGAATTAGGTPIPTATLTKEKGWSWRFTKADRDQADGAEASYHDPDAGKRKKVTAGGEKRRKLKRTYANETDAKQAAQAEAKRRARGQFKFDYDLAIANPAMRPNQRVALSGWNTKIDAQAWLVESINTNMDSNGLKQSVALESV